MSNFQMRATWAPTSEYLIDFEKGSIYHSKTASRGQTNRLFSDQMVAGRNKHLNYVQANDFYKKCKTAQMYLQLLRQMAVTQLGRGLCQATPSYIRNHQRFFTYPLNTLSFPVAQNISVGFVRSPLDCKKLVDWMSDEVSKSIKYGQVPFTHNTNQSKIADQLRKIAFAPQA